MKTLAIFAVAAAFAAAPSVMAADVDLKNLPEPTKELCSDADFMMSLSQKLQGETDQDVLMEATNFSELTHKQTLVGFVLHRGLVRLV